MVAAIAPNTPNGANNITYPVYLNITSARDSQNSTTGRAFRPTVAQAAPKMKAKTTIWSTSPFAIESIMLVGKVCSRICVRFALWAATPGPGPFLQLDSNPGFDQIDGAETDEKSDGCDNFKIKNRLAADAPHGFYVAGAGNPAHKGAEQERRNDGFDQAEENSPQDRHLFGGTRKHGSKGDSCDQRY